MSLGDQDFKNLTLKDIRFYRDVIQRFLDDTYAKAENAVENLFTNRSDPDFLKNLDEMNTLLKNCREKLVIVANSIPDIVAEPSQDSRPVIINGFHFVFQQSNFFLSFRFWSAIQITCMSQKRVWLTIHRTWSNYCYQVLPAGSGLTLKTHLQARLKKN